MPDENAPAPVGETSEGETSESSTSAPRRSVPRSWLIAGTVVIALPALLYGIGVATSSGQIPAGTTVAGVDIGGLDSASAERVLAEELAPRTGESLSVAAGEQQTTMVPAKAGVSLDAEATVAAARATGRGPLDVIGGLFGNAGEVAPVMVVDDKALDRSVTAVAKRLDRPVREGGIKFVGVKAVPISPVEGTTVNRDALAAAVVGSAVAQNRSLEAEVDTATPGISQSDVDAAMADIALPAVSAPVTVRVSGQRGSADDAVRVAVKRFTPHLRVRAVEDKLTLVVNGAGLRRELATDLGDLESPARDATFRIAGGRPVVVPSQAGRSVSSEELADEFAAAAVDDGARLAEVRLTKSDPELTTADAKKLGVVERISGFTQNFPYAPYRYQNIGQAAERINGTLLLPGDTFSMNETVKERTPENGYTTGFVIKDGRLSEDLGGGVSTATTAVWDAAFFAGLERIEQRAHSFYISRYKPGLEATVSWGNLDLKFRNNTDNGVFITAERGRNYVNVTMWGTKKYDVDAEFGPRTNVKPFGTVYDSGDTCTPQGGVEGFTIVVTRVIKEGGTVVKTEPLRTTYRPAANVLCRAAPAPKPTSTPKATSGAKPTPSAKPAGR